MEKEKETRGRGIYLLPNLFTTAGLFAGFYAIISALNDKFELAVIAILLAILMDGLDGRIARMTNTQSEFGAEFDSLADASSFGMAPALIMFEWSLHSLNKIGFFACFLYVATAALRLARFNTQIGVADKNYFQGLPSPAAAAIMVSLVWLGVETDISGYDLSWAALLLTLVTGLLMVSNVRYFSFKQPSLKHKISFMVLLMLVVGLALISISPVFSLFGLFLAYLLSGPIFTLYQIHQKRRLKKKPH